MDQAFVPEKTSKLVIRVKMDTTSNPSVDTEHESDTEYNPVALIILAIAILLFAGAGYYYFSSSNELDIPAEFEVQNSITEIPDPSVLVPAVVEKTEVSKVLPMVETQQKNAAVEVSETVVKVEVQAPVVNIEAQEPVAKVIPKESVVGENIVVDVASEKPDELAVIVEKDPEPVIVPIVDFSENIKRAQFTNDIQNREPTDLVEGLFLAKAEGLRRIYFFSELINLKGQTIRHQWMREGKLKSELKFNVGGNRWRVNSSKRLNPAAMGNWQVQVVNEAGDILISKGFEYKLP